MLIRPPVVREMRHNLWAKMVGTPDQTVSQPSATGQTPVSEADARLARLRELGELKSSGVLTDEEFAREKAKILG